jgi:two-component system, NarL family, nitrate/nitrite response regulator NarL
VNEEIGQGRIRLILLDGEVLFRSSLARLLALEPGLEVVAECANAADALAIMAHSPVDVVLLDLEHATDDEGFIQEARHAGYAGRFLIVAGSADARHAALAIRLGASGIFLKSEAPDRLVQALQVVANGAVWFDHRVIQLLADQSIAALPGLDSGSAAQPLTERERKVLKGIIGGLTNRKIGDNLGLSEGAVKASVQQLFHKTGVRTRSQLVRAALEGSIGTVKNLLRKVEKSVPPLPSNGGDLPLRT